MLYPRLHLNQRQDGFQHLAGRAGKHLKHLLLHDHFVHDGLEVAQGADHLLLVLLQPADLLREKGRENTAFHNRTTRLLKTFPKLLKTVDTECCIGEGRSGLAMLLLHHGLLAAHRSGNVEPFWYHSNGLHQLLHSVTARLLGNIAGTTKALGGMRRSSFRKWPSSIHVFIG